MRRLARSAPLILVVICITTGMVALSGTALAQVTFSGALSSASLPPGITGTGAWISPGFVTLGWTVSQPSPGALWRYVYSLGKPDCLASQLIIRTSPNFTSNDISNVMGTASSFSIGTFSPGPSFPNLPGSIFGILVNNPSGAGVEFAFDSDRRPVWGDFFAQGPMQPGVVPNSAENVGFGQPNPNAPPANGAFNNSKLLIPDTTAVPDASTLLLASSGLVPMLLIRRRRSV